LFAGKVFWRRNKVFSISYNVIGGGTRLTVDDPKSVAVAVTIGP
jgi:hypothetical protein